MGTGDRTLSGVLFVQQALCQLNHISSLIYLFIETESYVSQAGLVLMTVLLPLPLMSWEVLYARTTMPCLCGTSDGTQHSVHAQLTFSQQSYIHSSYPGPFTI